MQKLQEYFSVIAKAGAVQRWSVQGLWVNTWFWQGEVQEGGAGSMSSWPWACLHCGPHSCLPGYLLHRSPLLGWADTQVPISTLLKAPGLDVATGPTNETLATERPPPHWILCPLRWGTGTICLGPGSSISQKVICGRQPTLSLTLPPQIMGPVPTPSSFMLLPTACSPLAQTKLSSQHLYQVNCAHPQTHMLMS